MPTTSAERPAAAPVYLDHAASTPMHPAALATMTEVLARTGNPSSLHADGRAARRVVEDAREEVAALVGARPADVVLTSGGTEADNLLLKGLWWLRHDADPRRRRVLVPAGEHHAVLDPLAWLAAHEGAQVELVPLDVHGRTDVAALEEAIARDPDDVALVTCMWANNEVGTVQPIAEVVAAAAAHGLPVHTDAVQALGHLPVDLAASGVDAAALSAHKLGGPVGVGALVVRRELSPTPLQHGGGQERDLRSGTVPAAAVAALAVALRHAVADREAESARLAGLRQRLVDGARAAVPDVVVNGDAEAGDDHRLPGLLHLGFPGCSGEALLLLLDAVGVCCSTGSACTAGVARASHVLLAMGQDEAAAGGALRLSLGRTSTAADVDAFLAALPDVHARASAAGAVRRREPVRGR